MGELTKDKPKALVELKKWRNNIRKTTWLLKNVGITDITNNYGYPSSRYSWIFAKVNLVNLNIKCVENPKYSTTNSIYRCF